MKNSIVTFSLIMLIVLVAMAAAADDLGKATRLLCSTSSATICHADGECESGPPWTWNIPDFVEADLDAKTLSTTAASPEQRQTPIEVVRRDDGLLLLQGMEQGRAFSIVIAEDVGSLSAAVTREDTVITVFGACTPLQAAN